jgi:hypothetical protein
MRLRPHPMKAGALVVRLFSIVLGVVLFAHVTSALAHGTVVAFEKPNGTVDIIYSFNERTEQDADDKALASCIRRNGKGLGTYACLTIFRFHDACLGVARRNPFTYFTTRAQTKELAKEGALHDCLAAKGSPQQCNEATNFALCDTTPATLTRLNTETLSPAANFPAALMLLAALLLISSYWPAVKMRRRPKLVAEAISTVAPALEYIQAPSASSSPETNVAAAIATQTSALFNAEPASTAPVSKNNSEPEATIPIEAILEKADSPPVKLEPAAPNPPDPPSAPAPAPPAPQTTSLVVVPQRTIEEETAQALEQTPTPRPPVEPPAIIDPREGMVLKIKRSTKDGVLGRVIYMIDARLDASAEIRATIAKHRLGSRVIYESDARQEHRAAALQHLEDSRSDTSVFAAPPEIFKGAAKTFWKMGRAAVSATRAALSLRITVNSLLSGVHIECKDFDELQEAEDALVAAKTNLEGYLVKLGAFDGSEEVL